jgi:hypothetical protein
MLVATPQKFRERAKKIFGFDTCVLREFGLSYLALELILLVPVEVVRLKVKALISRVRPRTNQLA